MDIVVSGQRGILGTLYPAGALQSIKDLIFHPEVVDKSLWRNGIHRWGDPQGQYVFIHAARSSPIGIAINTKLVQRGEIKSFWDLLKPKWKGKIVSVHPRVGGVSYNLIYENKELGPEYLRRIYSEGALSYVATAREYADGLALGAFAIGFLLGSVQHELNQMIDKGMPVAMLSAQDVGMEVAHGTIGGTGLLAAVTRAANPNAQKLFVNWYLTREGQRLLNKGGINEAGGEYQSLRADVPNDDILPHFRLPENFRLPEAEPDFVEREAKAYGYVIELADKLGL
jgi:iron(III) transport system substrate-binding protein